MRDRRTLRTALAGIVGTLLVGAGLAPSISAEPPPPVLRPNLVAERAYDLRVTYEGGQRKLRFTSALGSIGKGPIEVRPNPRTPCPDGKQGAIQVLYRDVDLNNRFNRVVDTELRRRQTGCMLFHPTHDHWHFEAASRYTIYRVTPRAVRRVVTARKKMSFCLRDTRPIAERFGTWDRGTFYGACSRTSPQGITIGWVDVYPYFLPGQALVLPRRPRDGLYCLRIRVDPQNQLIESDDEDNISMRAFEMRGDEINYVPARNCEVPVA